MGLFDSILIPIDGSQPSAAGCALATGLAKTHGGRVTFVNVVDVGSFGTTSDYAAIDAAAIAEEARTVGRDLAESAAARARTDGLAADACVLDGPIVDRLLEAIHDLHATVVVMGSHGRAGIARAILGSTTEGVLRRSPVPVLVAPHIARH